MYISMRDVYFVNLDEIRLKESSLTGNVIQFTSKNAINIKNIITRNLKSQSKIDCEKANLKKT